MRIVFSVIPYGHGKSGSDIQTGRGDILKAEGDSREGRQRDFRDIERESLTDWLQNKKQVSTPDFVAFIKQLKNAGKSLSGISSVVLERYGVSLDKDQLKSLSR